MKDIIGHSALDFIHQKVEKKMHLTANQLLAQHTLNASTCKKYAKDTPEYNYWFHETYVLTEALILMGAL